MVVSHVNTLQSEEGIRMSEIMNYPASGSLTDLSSTCGGDEDGFRGPLVNLERAENTDGQNATRATYEPVPPQHPYVKKTLFFVDLASPTPQPPGTDVVFDSADVYLNGTEAQVAVYRQQ
jgi:hypothetical protein